MSKSMSKSKILIQLDPDHQPSVFDAVVAVDAGVDHLLQYGGVTPDQVEGLVHGAMFTRGPQDLHSTAIFIGGSRVAEGEALLESVSACFFGPMRVSVLLDSNGANTTAAAAVLAAARHVELAGCDACVLGGTGPVGQRAARLLARAGARVRLASRDLQRAASVCESIRHTLPEAALEPCAVGDAVSLQAALATTKVLIAAGAAGVELVSAAALEAAQHLQVAIDLNAVPPLGLAGVGVTDAAKQLGQLTVYGAIGVGGTKMKIHRAAIQRLFTANDQVLDAEQVFELGKSLDG